MSEENTSQEESSLQEQVKQAAADVQAAPSAGEQSEKNEADAIIKEKIAKKLLSKDVAPQQKRERKLGDLFTGRRKRAIARVKLVNGSGKYMVNKKEVDVYFGRKTLAHMTKQPLVTTGNEGNYDVHANVRGGGPSSQAEAIRLAVARCLQVVDEKSHKKLREAGFLTRDSRMVERKKYGLHKARRAPQFSKR